jgi:hypothetical protein
VKSRNTGERLHALTMPMRPLPKAPLALRTGELRMEIAVGAAVCLILKKACNFVGDRSYASCTRPFHLPPFPRAY